MSIFTELSVIIVIATAVAIIMRLLKQPLIIGHIITGLIVGPYFLNVVSSLDTIAVFSHIGIAFLLFIVGINLSPRVIREVGVVSVATGLGQIIFTTFFGYLIAKLLGFSNIASLYIAIALTFSSTIIILKLLSDKGDLNKLYGKISIGFLLVQDIAVVIILLLVSTLGTETGSLQTAGLIALKGIVVIGLIVAISMFLLPKLSRFFAKSQELLFLFSISWGLGLATLMHHIGFSIEIGALAAGVALSASPYHLEISSRLRPLRDFFIILFFILLGAQMVLASFGSLIIPVIILSLFILIGNPLIVMILMGILGYKKKTNFFAGLTVAQISEFSLILILLGVTLGHLTHDILVLVTFIGIATIGASTYMIIYNEKLYSFLSPALSIFERRKTKKESDETEQYSAILFGFNRIGYDFAKSFKKLGEKYIVVDFDPEVIKRLSQKKVNTKYGDADDEEFLNELNLNKIELAVSTIPELRTNSLIITEIRKVNKKAVIVVISHNIEEAEDLYRLGASYVVMPHFLGGHHASKMIEKFGFDTERFARERKRHQKYLERRKLLGHAHPSVQRDK